MVDFTKPLLCVVCGKQADWLYEGTQPMCLWCPEPRLVKTTQGLCRFCDREQGWSQGISEELEKTFPGVEEQARNGGVPSNHPFWVQWKALYARFDQPVCDFSYDAFELNVCAKHLRRLAELVEAPA